MKKKKKSLSESNKFINTKSKRKKSVVDAVYTSAKIEGSKTTKKQLQEHYKVIHPSSSH